MGIPAYGVWAATPTVFTAQRTGRSPHGKLTFDDGTNKYQSTEADINVKSTTGDTRLVYWSNANFTHPITSQLANLQPGYTSLVNAATGSNGTRLDLLRDNLETLTDGKVLATSVPGANNDIVDDLTAVFNRAIQDKATVYLWGSQYVDSGSQAGIHDIHMNQGDSGNFTSDNGTWQDGSFILKFSDGHYEAVFLAFAEQYTQTDNNGQPISGAPTFAQLLNSPDTSSTNTKQGNQDHQQSSAHHSHHKHHNKRHAKHVQRHGEQYEESPMKWASHGGSRRPSHVVVHDAAQKRDMTGWTLVDQQGKEHKIKAEEAHGIKNGDEVEFPDVPLNQAGGTIYLKDAHGKTVNDMIYSKFL
ncbi:hypothetical protein BP5796_04277 [Coleophoma crateriformis]|uniref:DUF2278 family protein n=1 Tax=Coleophoma crateriformis TaxID=565419 RepID=A0A3D8SI47_9HELO|nr:hypothetical protein BP5796_04277 [Coleophoma crateriformis]